MKALKILKLIFQPIQKSCAGWWFLLVSLVRRPSRHILTIRSDQFDLLCVQEIFRHIKQIYSKGGTALLDISAGEINGVISSSDFLEASIELLSPKKLKELWSNA